MSTPVDDIRNAPKISVAITLSVPGPEVIDRRTAFTVVLVRGAVGDYAAYIGAGYDREFVKMYGEKLTYDIAAAFFPSMALEEAHYRK
jgi:hypothetical protein